MDIGTKIKKIRTKKGYSQLYMANKLGITTKTYSSLETQKNKIDAEKIQQIAKVLEIDWLELLKDDDKITQINGDNSNNNHLNIYTSDKDLAHALEKSQQEVSFLKEKITSLQTEIENLKEINGFLREKTK